MAPPVESDILEVKFKGSRKEYFRANVAATVIEGDYCVVRTERGKECGVVAQTGTIAATKAGDRALGEILRQATSEDMDVFWDNAQKEVRGRTFCLGRIAARRLDMKLVDVEWQFDSNKVTFYFTAEKRVDFRDLVKDLAAEFRTRIELRQIGVRDEAKRKDGYGSCGRRLCCSSWLPEFQPITLKMARDQNLSVSPNKISGLCGRLLCCLSYEVEQYRDVVRSLPPLGALIKAGPIEGVVVKVDVFNRRITVRSEDDRESFLHENAWRTEYLVASRAPRREPSAGREGSDARGGRDARGGHDTRDARGSRDRRDARPRSDAGGRSAHAARSDREGRAADARAAEARAAADDAPIDEYADPAALDDALPPIAEIDVRPPIVWRGLSDPTDEHVPEDDAPPP